MDKGTWRGRAPRVCVPWGLCAPWRFSCYGNLSWHMVSSRGNRTQLFCVKPTELGEHGTAWVIWLYQVSFWFVAAPGSVIPASTCSKASCFWLILLPSFSPCCSLFSGWLMRSVLLICKILLFHIFFMHLPPINCCQIVRASMFRAFLSQLFPWEDWDKAAQSLPVPNPHFFCPLSLYWHPAACPFPSIQTGCTLRCLCKQCLGSSVCFTIE